jgi:hypothetical protein
MGNLHFVHGGVGGEISSHGLSVNDNQEMKYWKSPFSNTKDCVG